MSNFFGKLFAITFGTIVGCFVRFLEVTTAFAVACFVLPHLSIPFVAFSWTAAFYGWLFAEVVTFVLCLLLGNPYWLAVGINNALKVIEED